MRLHPVEKRKLALKVAPFRRPGGATPFGIFGLGAVVTRGYFASLGMVVTAGYLAGPPPAAAQNAFWGRTRIQPADSILYIHNDNLVQLLSLVNLAGGQYENGAEVSLSVFDRDEMEVAGPMIMPYIAGSNGNYQIAIPYLTDLKPNHGYTVRISVETRTTFGEWNIPVLARWREGPT